MLLATWIFAPPQAGEKDERRFEKRNLCSRVPRLRFHVAVFWSHAKSSDVLGGTLVKMRPGAAVMAHPRRRMAVGCHRPRAQRGTSCCAVTGASSAALRGGEMFRLLAFFHEPSTPSLSPAAPEPTGTRGRPEVGGGGEKLGNQVPSG